MGLFKINIKLKVGIGHRKVRMFNLSKFNRIFQIKEVNQINMTRQEKVCLKEAKRMKSSDFMKKKKKKKRRNNYFQLNHFKMKS